MTLRFHRLACEAPGSTSFTKSLRKKEMTVMLLIDTSASIYSGTVAKQKKDLITEWRQYSLSALSVITIK